MDALIGVRLLSLPPKPPARDRPRLLTRSPRPPSPHPQDASDALTDAVAAWLRGAPRGPAGAPRPPRPERIRAAGFPTRASFAAEVLARARAECAAVLAGARAANPRAGRRSPPSPAPPLDTAVCLLFHPPYLRSFLLPRAAARRLARARSSVPADPSRAFRIPAAHERPAAEPLEPSGADVEANGRDDDAAVAASPGAPAVSRRTAVSQKHQRNPEGAAAGNDQNPDGAYDAPSDAYDAPSDAYDALSGASSLHDAAASSLAARLHSCVPPKTASRLEGGGGLVGIGDDAEFPSLGAGAANPGAASTETGGAAPYGAAAGVKPPRRVRAVALEPRATATRERGPNPSASESDHSPASPAPRSAGSASANAARATRRRIQPTSTGPGSPFAKDSVGRSIGSVEGPSSGALPEVVVVPSPFASEARRDARRRSFHAPSSEKHSTLAPPPAFDRADASLRDVSSPPTRPRGVSARASPRRRDRGRVGSRPRPGDGVPVPPPRRRPARARRIIRTRERARERVRLPEKKQKQTLARRSEPFGRGRVPGVFPPAAVAPPSRLGSAPVRGRGARGVLRRRVRVGGRAAPRGARVSGASRRGSRVSSAVRRAPREGPGGTREGRDATLGRLLRGRGGEDPAEDPAGGYASSYAVAAFENSFEAFGGAFGGGGSNAFGGGVENGEPSSSSDAPSHRWLPRGSSRVPGRDPRGFFGPILPAEMLAATAPLGAPPGTRVAGGQTAAFEAARNESYRNREKARDALLAELRALAGEASDPSASAAGGSGFGSREALRPPSVRARELVASVRPENIRWFAELVVARLAQAAAAGEADEELASAVTPARLARLHRRLTENAPPPTTAERRGESNVSNTRGGGGGERQHHAHAHARGGAADSGAGRSRGARDARSRVDRGGGGGGGGRGGGGGGRGGGGGSSSFGTAVERSFACLFPPSVRPYVRLVEAADSHVLATAMTRALVAALHALDPHARPEASRRRGGKPRNRNRGDASGEESSDASGSSSGSSSDASGSSRSDAASGSSRASASSGFASSDASSSDDASSGGSRSSPTSAAGPTERALAAAAVAGALGVLAFGAARGGGGGTLGGLGGFGRGGGGFESETSYAGAASLVGLPPGVDVLRSLRRSAASGDLLVTAPWALAFLRFSAWDADAFHAPEVLAPLAWLRAARDSGRLRPSPRRGPRRRDSIAAVSSSASAEKAESDESDESPARGAFAFGRAHLTLRAVLARGLDFVAPVTDAQCRAMQRRDAEARRRAAGGFYGGAPSGESGPRGGGANNTAVFSTQLCFQHGCVASLPLFGGGDVSLSSGGDLDDEERDPRGTRATARSIPDYSRGIRRSGEGIVRRGPRRHSCARRFRPSPRALGSRARRSSPPPRGSPGGPPGGARRAGVGMGGRRRSRILWRVGGRDATPPTVLRPRRRRRRRDPPKGSPLGRFAGTERGRLWERISRRTPRIGGTSSRRVPRSRTPSSRSRRRGGRGRGRGREAAEESRTRPNPRGARARAWTTRTRDEPPRRRRRPPRSSRRTRRRDPKRPRARAPKVSRTRRTPRRTRRTPRRTRRTPRRTRRTPRGRSARGRRGGAASPPFERRRRRRRRPPRRFPRDEKEKGEEEEQTEAQEGDHPRAIRERPGGTAVRVPARRRSRATGTTPRTAVGRPRWAFFRGVPRAGALVVGSGRPRRLPPPPPTPPPRGRPASRRRRGSASAARSSRRGPRRGARWTSPPRSPPTPRSRRRRWRFCGEPASAAAASATNFGGLRANLTSSGRSLARTPRCGRRRRRRRRSRRAERRAPSDKLF